MEVGSWERGRLSRGHFMDEARVQCPAPDDGDIKL